MPSQSNQILTTQLKHLVSQIKVRDALSIFNTFSTYPFRILTGPPTVLTSILVRDQTTRWNQRQQRLVYSVSPSSLLSFTIEKLLASKSSVSVPCHWSPDSCDLANAHRVFVTAESGPNSPSHSNGSGNLTGIVSIVDSKSKAVLRFPRLSFSSSRTICQIGQASQCRPDIYATPPTSLFRVVSVVYL